MDKDGHRLNLKHRLFRKRPLPRNLERELQSLSNNRRELAKSQLDELNRTGILRARLPFGDFEDALGN